MAKRNRIVSLLAALILVWASEYAEWVTEQTIVADGGLSLIGAPRYYERVQQALGAQQTIVPTRYRRRKA